MDNKHKMLLVLAAIFIISVVYRTMNPYRQKTVEELTYATVVKGINNNISNKVADPETMVILDMLKHPPPHSGTVYKNIFFDQPVKKTKVPVSRQIKKTTLITNKSPIEQVKKELAGLKLFGIYETENKISLFIELDNQIIVVNKGDQIKGRYLVKKITRDSISLNAKHINETLHIDFDEFVQ